MEASDAEKGILLSEQQEKVTDLEKTREALEAENRLLKEKLQKNELVEQEALQSAWLLRHGIPGRRERNAPIPLDEKN